MNNLGLGLIVAGGFLFGIGESHVVLLGNVIAIVGIIMIALGLLAFFAIGRKKKA